MSFLYKANAMSGQLYRIGMAHLRGLGNTYILKLAVTKIKLYIIRRGKDLHYFDLCY